MDSEPCSHQRSIEKFISHYDTLRDEFLEEIKTMGMIEPAISWIKHMSDYNTKGGKMNRGLSVVESVAILTERSPVSDEEMRPFYALGWCIEWLQASFLVGDDMMDASLTRRGQACWYKRPEVGLVAINDCFAIQSILFKTLRRYFGGQKSYVALFDLFVDIKMRTELGQLCDLLTAPPQDGCNFARFTDDMYMTIIKYKTAYYSFYLPVVATLIALGQEDLEKHLASLERVLIELGQFFQVQDDFLDCYGDPVTIGKIGTDIQEGKCTWLILTALRSEKLSSEQMSLLEQNYGRRSIEAENIVKSIYRDLDLESQFHKYEVHAEGEICALITELRKVNEKLGKVADLFASRIFQFSVGEGGAYAQEHMVPLTGIKLLHREIQRLRERPIDGIKLIPNEADLFSLTVSIVGPETSPYSLGQFMVKLTFSEDYPRVAPKGQFVTTIFHPNVSPTNGDICVSTLQKDWRPDLGLGHLLLTIKSLLMTPNPESALNEAAGKLLLEDYEEFYQRATLMTRIHARAKSIPSGSKHVQVEVKDQENPEASPNQSAPNANFIPRKTMPLDGTLAETRKKLRRL